MPFIVKIHKDRYLGVNGDTYANKSQAKKFDTEEEAAKAAYKAELCLGLYMHAEYGRTIATILQEAC